MDLDIVKITSGPDCLEFFSALVVKEPAVLIHFDIMIPAPPMCDVEPDFDRISLEITLISREVCLPVHKNSYNFEGMSGDGKKFKGLYNTDSRTGMLVSIE